MNDHSPTHWIDQAIGERYRDCRISNFRIWNSDQQKAVNRCVDYVENFPSYASEGRGLLFFGPVGTGKDHLAISVLREICRRVGRQGYGSYRDGRELLNRIRDGRSWDADEKSSAVIKATSEYPLLCVSDPLPTIGELDERDQQAIREIINRRYRENLPTIATINASGRNELLKRLGSAAADRLLEQSVNVLCNWESYRERGRSVLATDPGTVQQGQVA
jgi:DNA replication protein DnaC